MSEIIKHIPFLLRIKSKSNSKRIAEYNKEILKDIQEVKKQLQAVEAKYNLVSDNDLVDALIFEECSLKARYAYLLRLAKTNGIVNQKITELI